MSASSFRYLRVWQQAMNLAIAVYRGTDGFPKHELYALAQQMRRAAVSIASNVAAGKAVTPIRSFDSFCFTLEVRYLSSKRKS